MDIKDCIRTRNEQATIISELVESVQRCRGRIIELEYYLQQEIKLRASAQTEVYQLKQKLGKKGKK